MVNLEQAILNVVTAALEDRYIHPMPSFLNRERAAAAIGLSPQSFDRLFEDGMLNFEQHASHLRKKGRIMYYMPEILKTLQPSKATIRIFGDQNRWNHGNTIFCKSY